MLYGSIFMKSPDSEIYRKQISGCSGAGGGGVGAGDQRDARYWRGALEDEGFSSRW